MRAFIASLALLVFPITGCSSLSGWLRPAPAPNPKPASAADAAPAPVSELPYSLMVPEDYVVRLVTDQNTCTGTLIAEDLVLTAHHCVARRDSHGELLEEDLSADEIRVELGGDHFPWGDSSVREILAPPCGHRAGVGDIAILVLEKKLAGVQTLAPDLDLAPSLGDSIHTIGFGRCVMSTDTARRKQRAGGAIHRVLDSRFSLDAAICPGDSGGPALNSSGKLIGVVSRSAMDDHEHTADLTEFTRLDAYRGLFANARAVSNGSSPAELPPVSGCPVSRE